MTHSGIIKHQSWHSLLYYRAEFASPEMLRFFNDPDEALRFSKGPIFKATFGDTSTVAVVEVEGKPYVVKRYNMKGWLHRLKRAIFTSKAMISWRNAMRLRELDIRTISPVAIIERRFFCLKGTTYLITELSNGVLGRDYFAVDSPFQSHWPVVMEKIIKMALQLKKARLIHQDFQWGNMIILNHEPYLLDLDHMSHFTRENKHFIAAHQRDLNHFHAFLKSSPFAQKLFEKSSADVSSSP